MNKYRLLSLLLISQIMFLAKAQTVDDLPYTTIVDEDFHGLTSGTEDEPDPEELVDDMGWIIDASVLNPIADDCAPGWGGYNLYSAGGCLAVVNGFLNTPTGNYSGNLKVSFRARLMAMEEQDEVNMDILLCRRSALIDFERKPIILTREWQTYTMEATNGSFSDCMIQFFTYEDACFLLDDIKITHQITSIEPPKTTDPYELQDDGFTAYWNGTKDASEYLLSVYSKTENPDGAHVQEGFDNLNVKDNEIDGETPNIPQGWSVSAQHVNTTLYSSEPYSISLDADGESVTTPKSDVPLSSFKFWARIDDNGQEDKASGFVNVYANTDYGWFLWVYFSVEKSRGTAGGLTDLTDAMGAFDNIYQLRIEYENPNGDKCRVLIDDVDYIAPGTYTKEFVFEDKVVAPCEDVQSCIVTDLDPDTDYFYYVKARNSQFTSEPSNEMEVFDVSNPIALPATEVGENSYNANWQCNKKVDYFRIDQMRNRIVEEDTEDYVILAEDFSKIVSNGDEESPEYGEFTTDYYSIDEYTHTGGWKASSPQYGNGMIGGMYKQDGYIAGCIATPTLDLSHNNGVCNVTIRAWAYEGDWLVIQGNNTSNYAGINFPTTGWIETTVQLPLCTNEERLYIYSNSYYPFMIDDITITQSVKKGEVITLVDKSVYAEKYIRSVCMENVDFANSSSIEYKIVAHRYYHGNTRNIWESPYSEAITVTGNVSGIQGLQDSSSKSHYYDLNGRPTNAKRGILISDNRKKFLFR